MPPLQGGLAQAAPGYDPKLIVEDINTREEELNWVPPHPTQPALGSPEQQPAQHSAPLTRPGQRSNRAHHCALAECPVQNVLWPSDVFSTDIL